MSDGALQVLDGTHLRGVDLSLGDGPFTGANILEIARSRASSSLFGLSLPDSLKASALTRLRTHDVDAFRSAKYAADKASEILRDYIAAIADELKDNPLVVSILDGSTLRLLLEDEDDFAMLAESLFTDLDVEDKGKISKSKIRNALVQMGVEMGVPPFSEFPQLNDLLRKHGADGEEELGQAQFAQLLQSVLQDLEEELSKQNVVFIQNIQIINGSKLRQILANEQEFNSIVEKALREKPEAKEGLGSTEIIRSFLQRNAKELGLPPAPADETVVLLYDAVFADVAKEKDGAELDKEELAKLVKDILEKFAEQLEVNPVYQDSA
ncbi:E3 ubiquitin protein ligase DRIP2 [Spatholobus suberectus]|nr:E3 ubiquitin protein ligase DRIP2 [Spatholobus suberectus]